MTVQMIRFIYVELAVASSNFCSIRALRALTLLMDRAQTCGQLTRTWIGITWRASRRRVLKDSPSANCTPSSEKVRAKVARRFGRRR